MKKQRPDEDRRRVYWNEQMEEAHKFMADAAKCSIADCGEKMISLRDAVDVTGIDVVFAETKVANNIDRIFFMREGLIANFLAIGKEMNYNGWVLKIEDAYRNPTIQKELGKKENIFDVVLQRVIWELNGKIPSPELMFRRLSALVATSPQKAPHISGSAIDISVLDRENRAEIDRGGPYLELSELTPMASPFPSVAAQKNRLDITSIFAKHGFTAYPYEFWHYGSDDVFAECVNKTGQPVRYGSINFDPATGAITPIEKPQKSLHSKKEILLLIKKALECSKMSLK